jgi:hypothetical protein
MVALQSSWKWSNNSSNFYSKNYKQDLILRNNAAAESEHSKPHPPQQPHWTPYLSPSLVPLIFLINSRIAFKSSTPQATLSRESRVAMPMLHLDDPLVSNDTRTPHMRIFAEQNTRYTSTRQQDGSGGGGGDALAILLPFLFVLSTLLFVMILFLVCVLLLRRRRGILLRDNDGPVDVSRDDVFNDADGGLAGVEERWLDSLGEDIKRGYRQAKCAYC